MKVHKQPFSGHGLELPQLVDVRSPNDPKTAKIVT